MPDTRETLAAQLPGSLQSDTEPVFAEPWQAQAFALVAALLDCGRFSPAEWADTLGADLKWEPSRSGALFPHLYRALRMADVAWDKSLPMGVTGHIFPEGVV